MVGTTKRMLALLSTTAIAAIALAAPVSAQVTVLDPITIIATRTEEYATETLAPVSVIRGETLQQLNASRIGDVLFGVSGVSTAASAQEGSVSINIRGMQDWGRVNVVVDGVRQNYARIGHTSGAGSFFLDPELIGGVDIFRGPASNIYGSGAIGGVVQFRTKDVEDILAPGQLYGTTGTLALAGGSGLNTLASIFAASRVNPNVDFVIGGTYRENDPYKSGNGTLIRNSGQNSASFLTRTTFRPADGHSVKLTALLQENDWTSGPPVTGASGIIRGWGAFTSNVAANYRYSKPEDRLFDFSGTVYWNRTDVDSTTLAVNPGFTGFYGPVGNRANYLIDTIGFDASNTMRFDTGVLRHALTVGGDLFKDDVQNRDAAGFGAGYNPRGERQIFGGFAQLKTNYSTWLETITAIRYDNYSLNGNHYVTGAAISTEGDRFSPKFTLGITPVTGFTVYASYAEGYRAPAVTETIVAGQHPIPPFDFLPNPNLRPEVGKTSEIGFNIKRNDLFVANDGIRIKANYFENRVDDFIESVIIGFNPLGPCTNVVVFFCTQYQNIPRARITGFEFEMNYDRGDWFVGLAGHAIRGGDLTNGDPLNNIPPDMVALTVGTRALNQKLVIALRWAAYAAKKRIDLPRDDPSSPGDEWATAVTNSYNLVNLYAGYDINPGLTAFLNATNLLNEQYRQYNYEYAAAGTTIWAGIKYRFGGAQTASNNVQSMLDTQNNQTRNLRASANAANR
ncbi:MAG: TonB-dependent hemoglobin/transferrin/lactoferrin family receptor [Xanthobacteraceae bacterium]|nr:TonB-dependent hemoglobin/transferrin/lactoferrin family receptor [Xanthobacteraceae bacterium]